MRGLAAWCIKEATHSPETFTMHPRALLVALLLATLLPPQAVAEPVLRPRPLGPPALVALADLIARLENDPSTDWRRVDLEAARAHLHDLDRLTLAAEAEARDVPGGVELRVRGPDAATEAAIRRLLPGAAARLATARRWRLATAPMEGGLLVEVRSQDPRETARIRALGLVALLVAAAGDEAYLLALARGEPVAGRPAR